MRIDVLPLDLKTLVNASVMRIEYGLMVNNSIMASTAVASDLEIIATAEQDFDRVSELSVAVPVT